MIDADDEQRMHRRARRANAAQLLRACQEAALDGGVVTTSGACVGVGDDVAPTKNVTFDLYKTGKGWSAILRLPMNASGKALMLSTSPAPTKAAAAKKSANLAAKALSSPLLRAALPPQAQMAAKILSSPLAKGIAKGAFKSMSKLF